MLPRLVLVSVFVLLGVNMAHADGGDVATMSAPGFIELVFRHDGDEGAYTATVEEARKLGVARLIVYPLEHDTPILDITAVYGEWWKGAYFGAAVDDGRRLDVEQWSRDGRDAWNVTGTTHVRLEAGEYRALAYGAGSAARWRFELPPMAQILSVRNETGGTFAFADLDFRYGAAGLAAGAGASRLTMRVGAEIEVEVRGSLIADFGASNPVRNPIVFMEVEGPDRTWACPCSFTSMDPERSLGAGKYTLRLTEAFGELAGGYLAHGVDYPQ